MCSCVAAAAVIRADLRFGSYAAAGTQALILPLTSDLGKDRELRLKKYFDYVYITMYILFINTRIRPQSIAILSSYTISFGPTPSNPSREEICYLSAGCSGILESGPCQQFK